MKHHFKYHFKWKHVETPPGTEVGIRVRERSRARSLLISGFLQASRDILGHKKQWWSISDISYTVNYISLEFMLDI